MSRKQTRRRRRPGSGDRTARERTTEDTPPCVLRIDRLASGGDAVATRDDGKTVFVEDGVPGDLVRARIVDERKRFARACIVEVLEPSPDRVTPHCQHFGVCGGCAWQHVAYPAQLRAKAAILRDALQRIGRFELDFEPEALPSPLEYGYRGRARVQLRGDRVGFLERGSHRLCEISTCPVLAEPLERAVLDLPGAVAPAESSADEATGEWSLVVGSDDLVSIAAQQSDSPDEPGLDVGEPEPVSIEVDARRLRLDARAFSQANRAMHQPLLDRVLGLLFEGVSSDESSCWSVLEIHAGIGFFTASLVARVGRVVAVESDPRGVDWLEKNLRDLVEDRADGMAEVEIFADGFADTATRLAGRHFDAVLLDPPRTGLAPGEVDALVALAPARIVYLACDPATQARDARALADAGWVLDHAEALDLFPQTPHTEGLIRLVRHDTSA